MGMVRKLKDRVVTGVLRRSGHMAGMDEGRVVKRGMKAAVSGRRLGVSQRYGWMDNVK